MSKDDLYTPEWCSAAAREYLSYFSNLVTPEFIAALNAKHPPQSGTLATIIFKHAPKPASIRHQAVLDGEPPFDSALLTRPASVADESLPELGIASKAKSILASGMKWRLKDLAAHIGCTAAELEVAIKDTANGLVVKQGGWVKLATTPTP